MRKLKVKDVAPAIKLVNAINVGEELKAIIAKGADAEATGVEIISAILKRYAESENVQKLAIEFFARPFEMTENEVEEMDLDVFMNAIKEIGGVKALADFFGSVTR